MLQLFRRRNVAAVNWAGKKLSRPDGTVGTFSIYEGASPAVTAAEILAHSAITSGGYDLVIEPDGDPVAASFGDTSRQLYDTYLLTWATDSVSYGLGAINNSAPQINVDAGAAEIRGAINVAMAPFDATALFVDADDAVLSYSITSGALVAGTTLLVDGSITGTPTVYGHPNTVTIRATDITGAYAEQSLAQYVDDMVPSVVGLSLAEATALLELAGFTVILGIPDYDDVVEMDGVRASSPSTGTLVEHGAVIALSQSLGSITGVQVTAYRNGHYGGLYRYKGDTFGIYHAEEYSPYWMTFVTAPPASWVPFLEPFVPAIDLRVETTFLDADRAQLWVDQGVR